MEALINTLVIINLYDGGIMCTYEWSSHNVFCCIELIVV